MWRALLSKEFRECGLYAVISLILQIGSLLNLQNNSVIPVFIHERPRGIPFLSHSSSGFLQVAILTAILLGFQQTAWESWRQTTLFLLHRPIPRKQIYLAKLTAGMCLIVVTTMVPLLSFALVAAIPGRHASPFYWGFTEPFWRAIPAALVCYLGAFLCGIRSARWIGSRTWPLVTALLLSMVLVTESVGVLLANTVMGALLVLYTISILDAVQAREYP